MSDRPDIPSAGELDAAGVRAAADQITRHITARDGWTAGYPSIVARAAITAYLTTAPRSVPGVGHERISESARGSDDRRTYSSIERAARALGNAMTPYGDGQHVIIPNGYWTALQDALDRVPGVGGGAPENERLREALDALIQAGTAVAHQGDMVVTLTRLGHKRVDCQCANCNAKRRWESVEVDWYELRSAALDALSTPTPPEHSDERGEP